MLDLLVASDAPAVVTGAMRNPSLAGPDGQANILAAIRVAASSCARVKQPLAREAVQQQSTATGPTSTGPGSMRLICWPAQTTVIDLIADSAHRGGPGPNGQVRIWRSTTGQRAAISSRCNVQTIRTAAWKRRMSWPDGGATSASAAAR